MVHFPFVVWALLLGQSAGPPGPQAPADTTLAVRGFGNQPFAWGTLALRNGQRLQAFLPATATGLDGGVVCYYLQGPDITPGARPKVVALDQVRWMRVKGHYSEPMGGGKQGPGRLATRRVSGAVELFAVAAAPLPTVSFLGPGPVLSSPAAAAPLPGPGRTDWYLRRANGAPVLVSPDQFAGQVARFLADDAGLARRVATGQAGYGPDDLEDVVRAYNSQHAKP